MDKVEEKLFELAQQIINEARTEYGRLDNHELVWEMADIVKEMGVNEENDEALISFLVLSLKLQTIADMIEGRMA